MSGNGLFSVGDFAKFSGTTKATLHHYDKVGLLSPASRGKSKDRYYSGNQFKTFKIIRTLQRLGVPLVEIKRLKSNRTPQIVDALFLRQLMKIDEEMDNWSRARKLLLTLQRMIHPVLDIDEQEITVKSLPAEPIVLGGLNDYSQGKGIYDAMFRFGRLTSDKYSELDLDYPIGGLYSEERMKRREWGWPDRYYFHNPEGRDSRPAALYAIGYARGGYGESNALHKRVIAWIDKNDLVVAGSAYEEYPLNEICIADDTNYLIRLMVTVRKKTGQDKADASAVASHRSTGTTALRRLTRLRTRTKI